MDKQEMGKKFLYQKPVRRSAFDEEDFNLNDWSSNTKSTADRPNPADSQADVWNIPHERTASRNQQPSIYSVTKPTTKVQSGYGFYSRHNIPLASNEKPSSEQPPKYTSPLSKYNEQVPWSKVQNDDYAFSQRPSNSGNFSRYSEKKMQSWNYAARQSDDNDFDF